MLRNTIVSIAGVLIAIVLLVFAGWLLLGLSAQSTPSEEVTGAFLDRIARVTLLSEIVVFPMLALIIGSFVGFFARERIWLSALVAILPVLLFPLSVPSFRTMILCVIYVGLTIGVATVVSRQRSFRNTIPSAED